MAADRKSDPDGHPVAFLAALGRELATQDNRGTADPLFMIQERVRRHVLVEREDPDAWVVYDGEGAVWFDGPRAGIPDVGPDDAVPYVWDWSFIGKASLTMAGAEAFVRRKGHDYPDGLRVWVASLIHVEEMIELRAALLALAEDGSATSRREGAGQAASWPTAPGTYLADTGSGPEPVEVFDTGKPRFVYERRVPSLSARFADGRVLFLQDMNSATTWEVAAAPPPGGVRAAAAKVLAAMWAEANSVPPAVLSAGVGLTYALDDDREAEMRERGEPGAEPEHDEGVPGQAEYRAAERLAHPSTWRWGPDPGLPERQLLLNGNRNLVADAEGDGCAWHWAIPGGEHGTEWGSDSESRAKWCADRAGRVAYYESPRVASLMRLGELAVGAALAEAAERSGLTPDAQRRGTRDVGESDADRRLRWWRQDADFALQAAAFQHRQKFPG
jgi:hypothetical protein